MIDLFAGTGGFPVAGAVVLTALFLLGTLVRHLPAIIWSLRCPRDSHHYRCPRIPYQRSAVPGLFPMASGLRTRTVLLHNISSDAGFESISFQHARSAQAYGAGTVKIIDQ